MAISWIGMYLKSLLVPNAIQSYSMFVNPENEQQLPQPHLYQLFLWSPTSNAVHGVFDMKKHPDVCLFV